MLVPVVFVPETAAKGLIQSAVSLNLVPLVAVEKSARESKAVVVLIEKSNDTNCVI